MANLNLMCPPGQGQPPLTNSSGGGLTLDQATCDMVACGAIPASVLNANMATPPGLPSMPFASACTAAGYGGPQGGRFCDDPVCAPYIPQIKAAGWGQALECGAIPPPQPMPSAIVSTMPSITDTATLVVNTPVQPPQLTPQSLVDKLPSIVNPAPVYMAPPCDGFAQWVNDNPMLAAGGLALLAYALLGNKGGR